MPRIHVPAELRRSVVRRARGRCEYCRIHQDDVPFSHQIDHIIPIKHGGQTVDRNLALACLDCNRHKGSDLTAIDPVEGRPSPLFNPRRQRWRDHFAFDGARVVGRTRAGRATVALLYMNDPLRLLQRQALIEARRYPPAVI